MFIFPIELLFIEYYQSVDIWYPIYAIRYAGIGCEFNTKFLLTLLNP